MRIVNLTFVGDPEVGRALGLVGKKDYGPPSTASPEEKKKMGIVWCHFCGYETFLQRDGTCGWCDKTITQSEAA